MSLWQKFNRLTCEYPMKVYPAVFFMGDIVSSLHGTTGKASLLWTGATTTGMVAHALKLAFGKGGETIPEENFNFNRAQIGKFLKDYARFITRTLTPGFWIETSRACKDGIKDSLGIKFRNAVFYPHRYPLDAGYILIGLAGVGYMLDASNFFGLRPEANLIETLMGSTILAGSSVAFLTNRNDLAANIFSLTLASTLAAGLNAGSVPLLAALPVYLLGNYIVSQVKTEHQSAFTSARQSRPKISAA